MRDFLGGANVVLTFRYGDEKKPDIPTANSVTYTVKDHTGTPLAGLTDVPIVTGPTDFQSTITILAISNAIDVLRTFERRTVVVSYTSNGVAKQTIVQYRLLPPTRYIVTAETVRDYLGINKNELPDDDVDVFKAYLTTAQDFGKAVLDAALISGTILEMYANDAIAMMAVLDVIQSIMQRIAQSEKNGIMGYDRPKIENLDQLRADAWARYYNGKLYLLDLGGVVADFTLITVTQDADPVTGG